MSDDPKKDWVETIADIAAALGFNRVRVRWKLDRLRRSLTEEAVQTKGRAAHVRYANKVCPYCSAVNDVSAKVCARCDRPLLSRPLQILSRIGIVGAGVSSISMVLGTLMVIIYARMMLASGGGFESVMSMNSALLFKHGASFAGAYHKGEWYRLLTSVFLHAGIWHIGFNLFALSQLGPFVEELFGKARMIFYFVLTGIVASLGSLLLRAWSVRHTGGFMDWSVAIGASGAIMGLMGIMAGWGQREGTSMGRNARNLALKWGVYTMVFGFFIGADNGAHGAGFIAGGIIGLVINPSKIKRNAPSAAALVLSVISWLLVAGAFVACMIPMPSSLSEPFENRMKKSAQALDDDEPSEQMKSPFEDICNDLRRGNHEAALDEFLVYLSPSILVSKDDIESVLTSTCQASSLESQGIAH